MTRDEQIAALSAYVRTLADLMCLKDWRIEVLSDVPDNKWHLADVSTIEGKKDARIRVCRDYFDKPADDRRHTICHELTHLHLSQLDDYCRDIFAAGQETSYNLLRELAVDEMARAMAPHLPLPEDGHPTDHGA